MVYYGTPRLIEPSGDATGATDVARINAGLANGGSVQLAPAPLSAPYWINAPITPTTGSRLWGTQWWAASLNDFYGAGPGASGGTVIWATNFTGSAMISMPDPGGTQQYGVDLAGFTLEGFSTGGSGARGIEAIGAWGACLLRGVCIHRPDSDCLYFDVGTGHVPDDWQVSQCRFSASRNGCGVNVVNNLPDSWFDSCEASQNHLDNWKINWCDNTRWTSCKGENSPAGCGWHFTANGMDHLGTLTGCTSQLNWQDGFLFDNSAGSGALGSYILTGCRSASDNQAASTFAAFRSNGSKCRIMGSGCFGAGAAYGAYEGGSSYGMAFTGSWFAGTTAATHDDATNTHALVNQSPVPF